MEYSCNTGGKHRIPCSEYTVHQRAFFWLSEPAGLNKPRSSDDEGPQDRIGPHYHSLLLSFLFAHMDRPKEKTVLPSTIA
jgi:hypothetical protein